VEWEVLEELTKYHREVTPCMCTRMITPYDCGPSSDELDLIALQCPIDVDDCSLFKEKEGTHTLWKTYLQEINLMTIGVVQFSSQMFINSDQGCAVAFCAFHACAVGRTLYKLFKSYSKYQFAHTSDKEESTAQWIYAVVTHAQHYESMLTSPQRTKNLIARIFHEN